MLKAILAATASTVLFAPALTDGLRHSPEADTTHTITVEEATAWSLETMELAMDGAVVQQSVPDVSGRSERRAVVEDELRSVAEGHVTAFARTFSELASASAFTADVGARSLEFATACKSELQDLTVAFTREDEDEPWAARFDEDESGDEAWLEGLDGAFDLAVFLPDGEVEVDESWEVEAAPAAAFLRAFGDLPFLPAEATQGSLMSVPTAIVIATALANVGACSGDFDGECKVTLTELGDEEATMAFELEVESELDSSERFALFVAEIVSDGSSVGKTLEFELSVEGEGELVWDLANGRAKSLSFTGELTILTHIAWDESMLEQTYDMEGDFELAGETEFTVTFER